jgi:hypothetical protein
MERGNVTYVQDAIDAVNAELPDLDPELARLYALLALTTGEATAWEDVHHAWAIWCDRTRPDHRSILPFGELAETTQELDAPYAEGIQRAAAALAKSNQETSGATTTREDT